MAAPTFSTGLSRRTMLAGGAAAVALPFAASQAIATDTDGDLRIALLAGRYRRAIDALTDWIGEAERRDGPFAYNEPEYSARYHRLLALEERCAGALARTRPDSLRGLVLKLRPAFHCRHLTQAKLDSDDRILLPALHDLERLAQSAAL